MEYPEIEARVAETYAARSTATLKNSLYDTYKMAIRWASDRIGEQGIVALVTNGSWIDGNVDSGVRSCLAEEFSSVHVLNLRGNARTSGDRRQAEGGNAFGQGSRAPVAITILVRNPDAGHEGCRILCRDVGDYLRREDKLAILLEAESIAGIDNWSQITPDHHHDWISQRDEAFQALYPIGSKTAKAGRTDEAIFRLFSNGYKTSRDAYIYNFSADDCAANARAVIESYQDALDEVQEAEISALDLDENRKPVFSRVSGGTASLKEQSSDAGKSWPIRRTIYGQPNIDLLSNRTATSNISSSTTSTKWTVSSRRQIARIERSACPASDR